MIVSMTLRLVDTYGFYLNLTSKFYNTKTKGVSVLYYFSHNSIAFFVPLQKHGPRVKCSACKIITHVNCIGTLMDRTKLTCKPTFRDVGIRQYREQTTTHHHWMHRRSEKGKCKHCGKVIIREVQMQTNAWAFHSIYEYVGV